MNRGFLATLSVIFLLFVLFLSRPVNADGFNIYMDRSFVALHGENTQIAAINYENGMEKLLLAVKMEQLTDDSVVWIVPVAADASEVKVNIFRDFPTFRGNDILAIAQDQMDYAYGIASQASLTQIYPVLIPLTAPDVFQGFWGPGTGYRLGEDGVEVYVTVEKEGITTQVLKAETASALYGYLNGKNITIGQGSLPILEDYIGEDYAFVVSWVRSIGSEDHRTPAVFVEFPTDRLYYPLKPTSIYGDRGIPVVLYVAGFAEPELYPGIEEYARVKYFDGGVYEGPGETGWLTSFHSNATLMKGSGRYYASTHYTTITIGEVEGMVFQGTQPGTPGADSFVQDLWIDIPESPPPAVQGALRVTETVRYLGQNYNFVYIAWLVAASLLASWLAGLLMFRGFGWKPLLLGFANCLTLVVFIIATFGFFKKEQINRPKFILAFTILFMIINFLVFAPLVTFFLF